MSDDSDIENKSGKRSKRPHLAASSPENADGSSPIISPQPSSNQLIISNGESSDSEEEEIIRVLPPNRRLPRILSDGESGDIEISDLFTDTSDDSSDNEDQPKSGVTTETSVELDGALHDSSSDSDGQSDKCPICLAKISMQEIGTPESCDHCFCVDCIQEWSKNVNTCPVDRQPFTLILVREHVDGKVTRQIPVISQTERPEEEAGDATFCEVCAQSDREDRMLLCDACDLGYHMECLTPPLHYVPIDEWYCPDCSPSRAMEAVEEVEVGEQLRRRTRSRPAPRLLPRTSQSERVQSSLRRTRPAQASSSSRGLLFGERNQSTAPKRKYKRRKTKRRLKTRIKRIYTDDGVVEVLVKKKKYGKKRTKRTVSTKAKSVKGRLASRLGMCAPRFNKQFLPDTQTRSEEMSTSIQNQRHRAGVPTLDIFGRRDQLDYFSGSDNEEGEILEGGGVGLISRVSVARPRDRLISRKKAASLLSANPLRKSVKVESVSSPANGNLLDSILDSQTLWHSKKTEIKSKPDGSLQVILPKSNTNEVVKENNKIDVRNTTAPVTETALFPGATNSGNFKSNSFTTANNNQGGNRSTTEQSHEGSQETSPGRTGPSTSAGGPSNSSGGGGPSPLRGIAPIRFRMNAPPKRPNIHSYPTDNIPPPPPLRLKSPAVEETFPSTNSPEPSPPREDEEIDIYSDIEQEDEKSEEKSFGVLEPPPEPTFLMTMSMDPPPEPPALLMNLNEDASDDEPSGLVIDDLPASDVYDPCAVNSDESSAEGFPLAKPPEIPLALKDPGLVADYSSDSFSSPYNPERPTYSGKPMIGPQPRPASHRSSGDSDEDCPNFSMYSATSMNIALRGLLTTGESLDIPIPPPLPDKEPLPTSIDIPLPDSDPPSPSKENALDIPIPEEKEKEPTSDIEEAASADSQICDNKELDQTDEESSVKDNEDTDNEDDDKQTIDNEKVDGSGEDDNDENKGDIAGDEDNSSEEKEENRSTSKHIKTKGMAESGEDECSTQGDVLDLAIESEPNLENNVPQNPTMECSEIDPSKSPLDLDDHDDKAGDGGDKSDGLVDITDEDMSVYDGQENCDDIDKLDEHLLSTSNRDKKDDQSLDSDDDNSLVGGATSAVSGGTLNNSDTVQPPTLPGLEGLETETISESEDVNFDELPLENNDLTEAPRGEDHSLTKKKKRKKTRKTSHSEEVISKTSNEPLEFEEGEIIEDKPKQVPKKDKKLKLKCDNIVEIDEIIDNNKPKTPVIEKEAVEKKTKKKKDKSSVTKDKTKDIKEKTLKPGQVDENISWKKLSKSTKERNYRDAKEKEEKSKTNENREKEESLSRKEKRGREKRKEMERYNVRRLISEKPKQPKKDEFGRDISPSKSGSSLSPYRPPRYRSPLRTRNRTRSRSKSFHSRSPSKDRKRRSRSRGRVQSRDRSRKARSRDRSRRSLSKTKVSSRSRERRRSPVKKRTDRKISASRNRKRTRSRSAHSKRRTSPSYSKSWSPSLSRSSRSRSRYRGKRRSKSRTRSKSRSFTKEKNVSQSKSNPTKDPPKNLTVIVTNKEALKKKEKKKPTKKKDDRRKRRKGQSPAPSKEVFTSGDNILVSVNFKNSNKNPELVPATTPLLKESSKRKRDETDGSAKKKKPNLTKKAPGAKKSSRLSKINEAAKNAKPVAIIDLDLSPFREQTLSPKEVIILSDSGDEEDKHRSQNENANDRLGHNGMSQSGMSLSSQQKNSMAQPESPRSSSYMMNSSGPKTPPEPHIKFSISTKPSQIRILTNPLMEAEEEMHDDNVETDMNEILHKGPNTPPEPPPDLHTPASPPTTPYDPFDPTKSRSPSPQPRNGDTGSLNISREDKMDSVQNDNNVDSGNAGELRTSTPPLESDDAKQTPDTAKVHSTPKTDPNNAESSPKVSPPTGVTESGKLSEDILSKPIQKLLAGASKADITIHKSPDKVITVVINQQTKSQTPKQSVQPMKITTPNKNQASKGNTKHQLFSSSIVKQVPILGTLLPGLPYAPLGLNNKSLNRAQQNGDPSDDMDIDPSSPYSPGSSEGDDLFEPPIATPPRNSKPVGKSKNSNKFDALFGSSPANKVKHGRHASKMSKKGTKTKNKGNKKEEVKVKLDEDQLKILDDLPSSAVEMQVKDKFLKKLNRQERVVEEVKLVLKPHYVKKHVTKDEYKEILRRSVPKICHNKSGEINPIKIQFLVEAYVKKFRYAKKKVSGNVSAPAQNKPKPQKTLWS